MDLYLSATFVIAFILALILADRKFLSSSDGCGLLYKFKWLSSFLYLKLFWKKNGKRCNEIANDLGLFASCLEEKNETPQLYLNALESPQVFDGISFAGTDNKGNCILIKIKRYKNRRAEIWLLIRTIKQGTFQLPIHPNTLTQNTKENSFSADGLTCQVLEPMRRWRISFNGFLRCIHNELEKNDNISNEKIIHAKFIFIWTAISTPYSNNFELSENILAHDLGKSKWSQQIFTDLNLVTQDNYQALQWGQLYGTLNLGEDLILHLRGLRDRSFGSTEFLANSNQYVDIQVYLQNGLGMHLAVNQLSGLKQVSQGSIYTSDGTIHPITWSDVNLHSNEQLSIKNLSTICFQAGGIKYVIKTDYQYSDYRLCNGEKLHYQTDINVCNFTLENINGFGFIMIGHKRENETDEITNNVLLPRLKPQITLIGNEKNNLVINTQSDLATLSNYTGGKGSSLALLHRIREKFIVPTSICVTSLAYALHLENCNHLKKYIQKLEAVAWKREKGNLEKECQTLVDAMKQTVLSVKLEQSIEKEMKIAFGEHYQSIRVAVRSSAIGEDSEELSSAGQNDTYLGMSGLENIYTAVINCWASQFTFIATEYKRQHGQLLNPGMAVVIQTLIPADVAGVLFTHDPSTGNPGRIIITANYGLGETVVSASAEPDTFILNRTYHDRLNIKEKVLGSKCVQIVQNNNKNGTENVDVKPEDAAQFCLSEKLCLELGRISILVEQYFGSARDIEWCITNEQIYLLQARPITSFDQPSDFEIMHEFDSPIKTEWEHCTKANTGEVFPNATTPLTLSTVIKILDLSIQLNLKSSHSKKYVYNSYATYTQVVAYNHCMLNCIDLLCRNCGGKRTDAFRVIEISVYGHTLDNDLMYEISGERYRLSSTSTFMFAYQLIEGLILSKSILDKLTKKRGNFKIPLDQESSSSTASSLYLSIFKLMPVLVEAVRSHCSITAASTFWNLVAVMTLTEGSSDWSESVYTDVATLLSNCTDVKSSEVPIAIQKLAEAIAADEKMDNFYKMDVQLALDWLNNHNGQVGKLFKSFLKNHGHRCVKELDIYSRTWRMDSTGLVQILQSLQHNVIESTSRKDNMSIKETIEKLQTPKKSLTKKLLTWILPRYRANVGYREQSKSILIHIIDQLRMAYCKLSDLMVNEGFLPDPQLIFFLTHPEIGQLLETRSAKLIKRALQRKRLHSYLEKLQFPEIIVGVPKPIEVEQTDLEEQSVLQISGTPVCNGTAKGVARVVLNLEEAKSIQPNDILITYCTDIGWSPYFPLLSGIVTEIGGIVSHGAVVAREYGLPCIVGAHNATRLFKSGEYVSLNGSKGILQKTKEFT